ncbi:MAG TPA: primosomal protein N' [Anaerolineaceae bacterium]|nr:primosomal protein N' [Anaerolineaceae bacterium]
MHKFAQVIVNIPGIDGLFDYHIPEEFQHNLEVGALIQVPFGKQIAQGIIHAFVETPQVQKTRPIDSVIDPHAVITAKQQILARWMAKETLSPISACYQLMLPYGLSQEVDSLYILVSEKSEKPLSPLQRRIIAKLKENGPMRGAQLNFAFRRTNWKESIRFLLRMGLIRSETYLAPPKVQPKMVKTAHLNIHPSEIPGKIETIGRAGAARDRRKAVLDLLAKNSEGVEVSFLSMTIGSTSPDLKLLAEAGLIIFGEKESIRDPMNDYDPISHDPPNLTIDQQNTWDRIYSLIQNNQLTKPVLLHGVTSSGKTELYLRSVNYVLEQNKTAIVLVPEISLTPQTVKRFQARFPGRVGIIHSQISPGARFDTWRRIRNGEIKVVVGPRSALFSPMENLGIIIVDECHDDSYAQDDITPRYNAIFVSEEYAKINNALLVFGSATPSIEMMYKATQQNWPIMNLPTRILAHKDLVKDQQRDTRISSQIETLPLPEVSVVDMRRELKQGNRSIFSRVLYENLEDTLRSNHQAILFLNRRGSATYVFCRNCGHRLTCPKCNIPLTFHSDKNHLLCHHCGYTRQFPKTCPVCKSNQIRQLGIGTEKVEQEVSKVFPSARIIRMDSGITRQKGIHEILLKQFAERKADILVGTQMLAKGIDFPYVTLVGVILADVGLSLPDYRASERTFQLLTQVAGRAGRSPLGGKVVFQTYQPEEYPIRMAAKHDFSGFYKHELQYRSKLHYPPFTRLIRLEFRHQDEGVAKATAESMGEKINFWITEEKFSQTDVIGPVPCFFPKLNSIYRWQIIIRGPQPVSLLQGKDIGDAIVTVDPVSLL